MASTNKTYLGQCPQCNSAIGNCTCPRVYEVHSGSHAISVNWYAGSFTAVTADRPSLVSESQKDYLATWPHGNFSFERCL